jgi:hypothetical protein
MVQPNVESRVEAVLEPGERVLWTGGPNVSAVLRRWWWKAWGGLALAFAVIAVTLRGLHLFDWSAMIAGEAELRFYVMAGALLLIPVMVLGNMALLTRWARSLGYALTNRRALVLEGGQVAEALGPDEVTELGLRHRARGHDDVMLARRPRYSGGRTTYTPIMIERSDVAFKGLPDAEVVLGTVREWLHDRRRAAEEEVAGFSAARPAASRASAPADAAQGAAQRIASPHGSLQLTVPVTWRAVVRFARVPWGTGAVSIADGRWATPDSTEPWNVILVEGPRGCSVLAQVHDTPPTRTLEGMRGGRLSRWLQGAPVEVDESVVHGRFRGFRVTRRVNQWNRNPDTGRLEQSLLRRETVLHDGRYQVLLTASWPEDSEPLRRSVDAIEDSLRVAGG